MKIKSIQQIEMSSECNLRCKYCVHRSMPRSKDNMSEENWRKSMDLVRHYVDAGTQGDELNIVGIGESLMHPNFVEYAAEARSVIGWDRRLVITTNGLLVTEEIADALVPLRPTIFVSAHRPEKAGPAIEILKQRNIIAGVSFDPSISAVDWAGQVDWFVSAPESMCPWVVNGHGFIMADGRISTCCFDSTGEGVIGTVDSDPDELVTAPYSLCEGCHQKHPAQVFAVFGDKHRANAQAS